jgi:hypothetical protein
LRSKYVCIYAFASRRVGDDSRRDTMTSLSNDGVFSRASNSGGGKVRFDEGLRPRLYDHGFFTRDLIKTRRPNVWPEAIIGWGILQVTTLDEL